MALSEAIVLYSGGTDSTLTASMLSKQFDRIHLITYDRFGIFEVENSQNNAKKLQEKYGEEKFVHKIINFDKIFQKIAYKKYLKNMAKYGFMNLSVCGLCKLSMHVMTVVYCLENDIKYVADGANKGMEIFPAQMDVVLDELREMYLEFGIEYTNPVFNYNPPPEKGHIKDENMALLKSQIQNEKKQEPVQVEGLERTTGEMLFDEGLAPIQNIKGSRYDQKRQPRCFQFMLFSLYVNKWYLPGHTMEEYKGETLEYFKSKIDESKELLTEFKSGKHSNIMKIREKK